MKTFIPFLVLVILVACSSDLPVVSQIGVDAGTQDVDSGVIAQTDTTSEVAVSSVCNCNDNNTCTIDSCTPSGECVHQSIEDCWPCTFDWDCQFVVQTCQDDKQLHVDGYGKCLPSGMCEIIHHTTSCDDGDPCTVDDCHADGIDMCVHKPTNCEFECSGGVCNECEKDADCDDGKKYTRGICVFDGSDGHMFCKSILWCNFPVVVDSVLQGFGCLDKVFCEAPNGKQQDVDCVNATCVADAQCDDWNPCTVDHCVGGFCTHDWTPLSCSVCEKDENCQFDGTHGFGWCAKDGKSTTISNVCKKKPGEDLGICSFEGPGSSTVSCSTCEMEGVGPGVEVTCNK